MKFIVTDPSADLRFRVGAAVEFDRVLDVSIEGQLASVSVESVHRDRTNGSLIVRFTMPNNFRLEELDIPDDDSIAPSVETYEAQPVA